MQLAKNFSSFRIISHTSSMVLIFLILTSSSVAFAHAGHKNFFQGMAGTPEEIKVDGEVVKKLQIEVKTVAKQKIDFKAYLLGKNATREISQQQVNLSNNSPRSTKENKLETTAETVLVIPSIAAIESGGKHIVYVQNGDKYRPVEVKLGRKEGNLIEVTSGISEGDRVVTKGSLILYAQSLRGNSEDDFHTHTWLDSLRESSRKRKLAILAGGAIAFLSLVIISQIKPQINISKSELETTLKDY